MTTAEEAEKAEKAKEAEKAKKVADHLIDIRDQGKNDRLDCCEDLFKELGHDNSTSVTIVQMDALLIKAAEKRFGVSQDADIILMAFGLLQGYEYNKIILITERREKYLRESNYLQTDSRFKAKAFDEATVVEQERAIKRLRKGAEERLIMSLAKFLHKQNIAAYVKNLDGYMTKGKSPVAILPDPSYTLSNSPDAANFSNTDTQAEGSHGDNININHNENKVVVQIHVKGGDASQVTGGQPPESSGSGSEPSEGEGSGSKSSEGEEKKSGKPSWWYVFLAVVGLFVVVVISNLIHSPQTPVAGGNIQVLSEEINMQPGDIRQLKAVSLAANSEDVSFDYTSSAPDVLKVLHDGLLYAQYGLDEGESASVEVTIRGNGSTRKVSVTIENSQGEGAPSTIDVDNFVIPYTLETQVRRVGGDKTWGNSVEAKIGDKVEFRVSYKNNSNVDQMNVGIKSVLPKGLKYVAGSTKLVSAKYPNGGTVNDDNIIARGINIGSYTAGSNAFVRFQAEVVDEGLANNGKTALVTWAQGGVNKTSIQDYAQVIVTKE